MKKMQTYKIEVDVYKSGKTWEVLLQHYTYNKQLEYGYDEVSYHSNKKEAVRHGIYLAKKLKTSVSIEEEKMDFSNNTDDLDGFEKVVMMFNEYKSDVITVGTQDPEGKKKVNKKAEFTRAEEARKLVASLVSEKETWWHPVYE